jgi:hypothetical protein
MSFHQPKYRIHIRWFNGLDRYDEAVEPVKIDARARTLSFLKSDGITISFPIEKLMLWEVAEIRLGGVEDVRLIPPAVLPPVTTRPDSLDWPVDTDY